MKITRGDNITVSLVLRLGGGTEAVNLDGATFETKFPGESDYVVIPDEQHTIADQDDEPGKVLIALTSSDTEKLRLGAGQDIVIKVTQGSAVKHYTAKQILTVVSDDPEYPVPQSNIFIGSGL